MHTAVVEGPGAPRQERGSPKSLPVINIPDSYKKSPMWGSRRLSTRGASSLALMSLQDQTRRQSLGFSAATGTANDAHGVNKDVHRLRSPRASDMLPIDFADNRAKAYRPTVTSILGAPHTDKVFSFVTPKARVIPTGRSNDLVVKK